MSTSYDYEIARLVPSNELARRLFSRCYIYCLEGDPWHLNFMISTGQEEPRSDEPIESSTEYDTGSENTSRILQHVGYFTLSFKHNHPRFPLLGWRVGRGNGKMTEHRGVDVLLTDPRDSGSKSIAGVHFRLSMNPQSGYLILNPDNDKAALESYVGSEWRAVEESRLIYEKSTMLRAGDCEYRLNYAFEDGHKSAFIAARNEFVKEYFSGPESTDQFELFNYLPGSNAQIIGDKLLRFGTQGTGTFGWVDQGLDMKTGNVLAIKEMRLKTQREWSAINQERKIGMKFEAREIGLLPTLGSFCEHGVVDESCRLPERFYIYMPLGLSDLSKPFWYNNELSLDERLQLLKEPLYGLKTLHGMGYMHRDIRPQNVIVLSYDPPRAALCDFGKTIFASTDRDTAIGPIHTCAPEVWQVRRQGPYDDKIDIWAYGYTIANVLGYACGNNDKITETRWTNIRLYLRNRAKTSSEDRLLIDLALSLLEWEPKKRLTAEEALRHECWNTKAAEEVPSSKRIKTACSERIKTTASDVEPTQAFSEETRALIDQKVLHLP